MQKEHRICLASDALFIIPMLRDLYFNNRLEL